MKNIIYAVLIAISSSIATVVAFVFLSNNVLFTSAIFQNAPLIAGIPSASNIINVGSNFLDKLNTLNEETDFTKAAAIVTGSVVNITATFENLEEKNKGGFMVKPYFEGGDPYSTNQEASYGSGVIVAADGYIITNNHVINKGNTINITLYNKRTYKAKLIGVDENTDIALLKIDANNLPAIKLGDSDNVQVGEWVLAVGNPFNLTSTVTAGIISAKGRDISLANKDYSIESFLQTDAAVNSGNSGGALVNTKGELIGINTAIATLSGTFAGYSFAVPVNIVKKVMDDLQSFGIVQRAFLGLHIKDIDEQVYKEYKLQTNRGVCVTYIVAGGGAQQAGILKGDVIIEINGFTVNSQPELQEKIARFRPGDPIAITLIRGTQRHYVELVLKNENQGTGVITKPLDMLKDRVGAEFIELTYAETKKYGVKSGLKLVKLEPLGLLKKNTAIREGFIILKLNNAQIVNLEQFAKKINEAKSGDDFMLSGQYPTEIRNTLYAFTIK